MRVDRATKDRMSRHPEVNWAEVVRSSLADRLELEEELQRPLDRRRAARAARDMDVICRSLPSSGYDSTKEVRRWRDLRR